MKAITIAAFLLISLNTFSQARVLTDSGGIITIDTPKIVINHFPLKTIPGSKPDSGAYVHYWLIVDSTQFKITSKGLALINPPLPARIPYPESDLQQETTASAGQKVFTFRNLPPTKNGFLLYRNGVKRPPKSFSLLGNNITLPEAQKGDYIELIMSDKFFP